MSLREWFQSQNTDIPDIIITGATMPVVVYNFGTTQYDEDSLGVLFGLKPKIIEATKCLFKHITDKVELTEEMIGLIAYLGGLTHATVRGYKLETLNILMESYLNIAKDNLAIELTELMDIRAFGLGQDGYLLESSEAGISINKNALERWS